MSRTRTLRWAPTPLALVALLLAFHALQAAPAHAGEPPPDDDPTIVTLRDAEPHADDGAYIARVLADFEVRLAGMKAPRAIDHYTHGWLLSHAGRGVDAVAAYDRALAIDKTLSDAHYNAGVVLTDLGREAEAVKRFEAALAVDPKHVDAAYNAGQGYYNLKQFERALALWQKALALAPSDFGILKKVLQAQNAVHDPKAAETRASLIALRKQSTDPRIRGLSEFCFDQFDVGKAHILAYETFDVGDPGGPSPDLYALYTFKVSDAKNQIVGSVNLESSAVIREQGTPYILCVSLPGAHKTTGPGYARLPTQAELRPAVEKLVRSEFAAIVKGP
ncbi:MAG: tetratricopeptide repeat protein [Myxococcota bacterium]